MSDIRQLIAALREFEHRCSVARTENARRAIEKFFRAVGLCHRPLRRSRGVLDVHFEISARSVDLDIGVGIQAVYLLVLDAVFVQEAEGGADELAPRLLPGGDVCGLNSIPGKPQRP